MNQQELKHILSSKFDFEKWKDLLGTMFLKIDYLTKPIQIEAALVKSGGQVGMIRLDDGRYLGLFKFEVADNIKIARNRKGLRDIAIKYVDQDITHGALVFYYSEDQADYRLTFVSKQTSLNEDGEFVTKATAPKRYTFLLGENEPCTTASIRLLELINKKKNGSVYLADVTETFSVERLNKDFFKGYKDQYGKFLNYIGEQSKANRDYVKKLLGRLVFLQFLQKKGWMGVPASNTNWEGGDKNYLNNLIENYKGNNRLLSDVLEVLFFNTLNEKRDNDLADKILGENIKIPYLNGGLFDKDSLDKLDIDFPYDYFKELMEFFAMYNFTIDENDPDDAEVGVDPEMLGHIFENLLEDNKDKGAFYTPKEIVQYMSQESIAQYLKTHTEETLHTAIEGLIKERKVDEVLQNKASASKVYDLLRDVKVCDPAIGSGAFPMGVLNVLYHSRQVLYGFTKSMEPFSPAAVKREIIQNNIYGVDIEQGAIDIARLRFWLALVVDELKPEPLPNLDYKIMQGNSLLESFEGLDMSRIAGRTVGRPSNSPQLIIGLDSDLNRKNLQKLMRQYFSTDDHTAKAELRQTINNEVKSLIRNSLGGTTASLNHLEQLDCSANSDFFLWHTWFKDVFDNGGFDVVIGNPPYNELRDLDEVSQEALKNTQYYEYAKGGRLNMFQFFYPLALGITKEKGILSLITQNSLLAENSTLGNRKLFMEKADILSINSFPERDNKNTRVFESVKMSVCICTLRITKTPDYSMSFTINVWHSKYMKDKHSLIISKNEILELYPDDIIIPICSNEKLGILKEINKKNDYSIIASAGEIDMTKYKSIFNVSNNGIRVVTGAQVLRYHITDNPSQGNVIYINNQNRPRFSEKRQLEISQPRIVLQRITGVDSRIRIISTYLDKMMYCANSTNYIPKDERINMKYLLAILNSTLINFYIKQTSTNTNITAKVLNSLPIVIPKNPNIQKLIAEIVEYVLCLYSSKEQVSKLVSNSTITDYFEKIIDGCVYELYFEDHMKGLEINIIDSAKQLIKPISQFTLDKEKTDAILDTFMMLKKTNNPIRNRMELFTLRSPELLKPIIEN